MIDDETQQSSLTHAWIVALAERILDIPPHCSSNLSIFRPRKCHGVVTAITSLASEFKYFENDNHKARREPHA
jgi:hypothetical protein